jgi:hypothetical protein
MSRRRVQPLSSRPKTARGRLTGAALLLTIGALIGPVGSAGAATVSAAGTVCPVPTSSSASAQAGSLTCGGHISLGVRWQ